MLRRKLPAKEVALTDFSKNQLSIIHLGQDQEEEGEETLPESMRAGHAWGRTQRRPEMEGSRWHGKNPGRRGGPAATWEEEEQFLEWRESGVFGE